jgi:voltage-gated potassium channel
MQKRIINVLIVLITIFLCGVAGYALIEEWSILDSLYMTIITLTTVGFMEVQPLSQAGRVFTIFLLVIGFSVIFYGLGTITVFIVEGELVTILRRRKMQKKISKLKDHYIICGCGDMGKHVINEFVKTRRPFVFIEKNESEVQGIIEKNEKIMYIIGDASTDAVLLDAGIENAKGLITTFTSDKDNLFVVLTARSLNSGIRIVTRCMEEESEHKLKTAGADSVVSAHAIGGLRMASEMLRPTVVSFLDVMLRDREGGLRIEETIISPESKIRGKTIKEANILGEIGLIIIAIKDGETGQYIYNPQSDLQVKENDILIVLGRVEQVSRLREYTT